MAPSVSASARKMMPTQSATSHGVAIETKPPHTTSSTKKKQSNNEIQGSTTSDVALVPTFIPSSTGGDGGGKSNTAGNTSGGSSGNNNGMNNSDGNSSNASKNPSGGNTSAGKGKSGDGSDSDSDSDDDDDNDDDDDDDDNGKNSTKAALPVDANTPCQTINDNDGQLQYTGVWTLKSKDPNGFYFTSHTTSTIGSEASILFNGTSITVMGTIHASNSSFPPATAAYIIDDDTPTELPLPLSDRDIPHQTFFESSDLLLGTHRLVINVTTDGSPYTLNSLVICSKATNPITAVTAPPVQHNRRLSHAAVAGIAVGGIFLFVLLIVACVLLRRRRRRLRAARTADSPITKWLDSRFSGTLFTSSESIMRNTPTNPSAVGSDPYDKLSRTEKALPLMPHVPSTLPPSVASIKRASNQSCASWNRVLATSDRQPTGIDSDVPKVPSAL